MNLLLSTAVALFAGLMMTRLFKVMKLGLPDVTAFLIAGGALLAVELMHLLTGGVV